MPNVDVRDTTTGQATSIDLKDLPEALASGKYERTSASTINTQTMGTNTRTEPTSAAGELSTGNVDYVNPNVINTAGTEERQKEAYNNFEDKALTFAEGVTDALTFGLVHERGDEANLRREVNSGSAFAGEIAGIALGLKVGGQGRLAELGEQLGKQGASALFGTSKLAARIGGEAGANMAISAAQATGHQVWDSILENKPIAVEAIAHEVGMAGLLGGGFGLLGGAFSRASTVEQVSTGSGAPEFTEKAAQVFDTSINEIRRALRQHETRIGVLSEAASEGLIPREFMPDRIEKLKLAQEAEDKLAKLGNSDYALKASPREAYKWQQTLEDLHVKVRALDEVMTPKLNEVTKPLDMGTPGLPVHGPMVGDPDGMIPVGTTSEETLGMNERMSRSPELQAKYKELHGREWTPSEGFEQISGRQVTPSGGEENLGGKVTPTSGDVTGIGKRITPSDVSAKLNGIEFKTIVDNQAPAGMPDQGISFDDAIKELKGASGKGNLERHQKFRKLVDDWYDESKKVFMGSPADRAVNSINAHINDFNVATGGRLDAAGSTNIARTAGFGESGTELGSRFQQAWSVNKLTNDAAKASRLSDGVTEKTMSGKGLDYLRRRVAGKIGAGVGGALVGGGLTDSKEGYLLGAAMAAGYSGFGGRVAGSIGRISEIMAKAGDALLAGRRSTVITQAIVAKNNAWGYSEKGPIKDPIERIQEIHHVAAHPEMIADQITNHSGDLTTIHPEMAQLLTQAAQARMMSLSIRAPKFMMDKWNQPIAPAAGALRQFLEYENALNNLEGTLKLVASGNVTKDMGDGIRDGWPAFSGKLTSQLLNNPEKLKTLSPTALRQVEHITGVDLSNRTNGLYISRQQSGWLGNGSGQQAPNSAPQSFKINSKSPETGATPTQSTNGRAPGN